MFTDQEWRMIWHMHSFQKSQSFEVSLVNSAAIYQFFVSQFRNLIRFQQTKQRNF